MRPRASRPLIRPSWIWALEGPGRLQVLLGFVQLPSVDGEQAGHDPDDDGGQPPHVGVVHWEAGLGLVPPPQLVQEAGRQAVEEQGGDVELGGAAEVGSGDRQRDHLVAPAVLGEDAPEVEVGPGHVGHVAVALRQLPGEVELGEGAVGVAGRLERHAEGMAGVALVER